MTLRSPTADAVYHRIARRKSGTTRLQRAMGLIAPPLQVVRNVFLDLWEGVKPRCRFDEISAGRVLWALKTEEQ